MDFQKSTQARNWLFTKDELDEKRRSIYNEVGEMVHTTISFEDYIGYIQYYGDELLRYAAKIGIWNKHQVYTALALYQRIWTRTSIWHIPPPLAMMNSIFLVCKFVYPVTFRDLAQTVQFDQTIMDRFCPYKQIAQSEIIMLSAIKFNMKVHLPYHHLLGLIEGRLSVEDYNRCEQCLSVLLQTDVLMLYPPGQIAFAVVAICCGLDVAKSFLPEGLNGTDPNIPLADELENVTQKISELRKPQYNVERCRQIEEEYGAEFTVQETLTAAAQQETKPTDKSIVPPPV